MELKRQRILQLSFGISTVLLVSGLGLCSTSLDDYAYGLYFILISIVGYIIGFSFCIVEPEDHSEKAIAKQMLLRAQKSIRYRSQKKPRRGIMQMVVQNRLLAENVKDIIALPMKSASNPHDETPIYDQAEPANQVQVHNSDSQVGESSGYETTTKPGSTATNQIEAEQQSLTLTSNQTTTLCDSQPSPVTEFSRNCLSTTPSQTFPEIIELCQCPPQYL